MLLQFQLATNNKHCRNVSQIENAELYHQLELQVPETIESQLFFVLNYLELVLDHEDIAVSSDKKIRYHF